MAEEGAPVRGEDTGRAEEPSVVAEGWARRKGTSL